MERTSLNVLHEMQAKCGSIAEQEFIRWVYLSLHKGGDDNEFRHDVFMSGKSQVRYTKERRFVADFRFTLPCTEFVFVEWEGGVGMKSGGGYRSHSGYLKHVEKYNYLVANRFNVLRLNSKNFTGFWGLLSNLNDSWE